MQKQEDVELQSHSTLVKVVVSTNLFFFSNLFTKLKYKYQSAYLSFNIGEKKRYKAKR